MPTIVSRCQRVSVESEDEQLPVEWRNELEEILCASDLSGVTVSLARSERMMSLLKNIMKSAQEEEEERLASETTEEADSTFDARVNSRYRELRRGLISFILSWYRDMLILHCGGDHEFIYNKKHLDYLKTAGEKISYRRAMNNVSIMEDLNRRLERNVPENLLFDFAFSLPKTSFAGGIEVGCIFLLSTFYYHFRIGGSSN